MKLSLTPRLRVFDERMLKRMFVPKREEVRGHWRKLHTKELGLLLVAILC